MVKEENEDFYRVPKPEKYFDREFVFGTNMAALKEQLISRIGSILAINKKSQKLAIPKYNEGPVKIIVGENFEENVTNSHRDAFIEFYSPDCKYCLDLEPIWDQLGEQMKNEDVDIMKIDVTANAWNDERYHVQGLPTIYWKFSDKTKPPIKYTNHRNLLQFIKFAAANATAELKGWDREGKPKSRKP